ncbi:hypothetical protein Hanom_Chr17g01577391 [Helianthus anomalus]
MEALGPSLTWSFYWAGPDGRRRWFADRSSGGGGSKLRQLCNRGGVVSDNDVV